MSYEDLYKQETEVDMTLFGQPLKAKVSFTPRYKDRRNAQANLVFVAGEKSPHQMDIDSKFYQAELAPGPRDKDELIDKLWDKYNKKEVKIMKYYLKNLRDTIKNNPQYSVLSSWMEESGMDKPVFNVYAGCSMCRCSPGFVIRSPKDIKNVAIHVNFQ